MNLIYKMPVHNIVDKRKNKFNVECEVHIEDSWHDNSFPGATQFPNNGYLTCDSIARTTIDLAIKYCNMKYDRPMTLFLYDVGFERSSDYQTLIDNGTEIIAQK